MQEQVDKGRGGRWYTPVTCVSDICLSEAFVINHFFASFSLTDLLLHPSSYFTFLLTIVANVLEVNLVDLDFMLHRSLCIPFWLSDIVGFELLTFILECPGINF